MNDVTMDNQQETYKIAWLAGIWDGEGTISIRQNVKMRQFSPRVHVTNTDANIINEVKNILNGMGVNPFVREKDRGGFEGSNKQCYTIGVDTLSKTKIILDAIMPYLVGKKAQAELLLGFINSRMNRFSTSKANKDRTYLPEDIDKICKIYELNGNQRGSSQTTREAFVKTK